MHQTLRYIILFVSLALIQVCFIDRLAMGTYIQPLIYACFIVMLPMQLNRMQTLLIGAGAGAAMDIMTGIPGLNTVATTAIAYVRPALLYYIVGQEEIREGGTPTRRRFAHNKFFFYAAYMFLIHSILYFGIESMSTTMIGPIAIRVTISTIVCMGAIYIVDRTFNNPRS